MVRKSSVNSPSDLKEDCNLNFLYPRDHCSYLRGLLTNFNFTIYREGDNMLDLLVRKIDSVDNGKDLEIIPINGKIAFVSTPWNDSQPSYQTFSYSHKFMIGVNDGKRIQTITAWYSRHDYLEANQDRNLRVGNTVNEDQFENLGSNISMLYEVENHQTLRKLLRDSRIKISYSDNLDLLIRRDEDLVGIDFAAEVIPICGQIPSIIVPWLSAEKDYRISSNLDNFKMSVLNESKVQNLTLWYSKDRFTMNNPNDKLAVKSLIREYSSEFFFLQNVKNGK